MALASVIDLRPAPSVPCNVEAEQALLGAVMYDREAVYAASDLLPQQFHEGVHGRLWAVIKELAHAGRATDPLLVYERLKGDEGLKELGGLRYLADLLDRAPPSSRASDYAAVIADTATRRDLIALGGEIAARAADSSAGTALEVLTGAETCLGEIASAGATRASFRPAADVIAAAIEAAEAMTGAMAFPTALAELDDMTGGLTAGEVAILGARTGMGKTVAALNIAKASARAGRGTIFFSLEMAAGALGLRLACDLAFDPEADYDARGNPTFDRARRNALSRDHWDRLKVAQRMTAGWPLLIDDRPGLTVGQMEACARRAHREWERRGIAPGPIVVDHMGIARPEKARGGNKVMETGDVSRSLAEMAKRLGVPVLACCQINRGPEGREDKRPGLSELRWSGAIEEDARLVIFLHRPSYFLKPPEDPGSESAAQRIEREMKLADCRTKLFWIVAKQNSGPLGQVETFCEIGSSAVRDRRELWP